MKLKKTARRIAAWGLALTLIVSGSGKVSVSAAKKTTRQSITLKVGKTKTLKLKNASKKVKWSTSNKKIVKITKTKGKKKNTAVIKAVKQGTATVTAKSGARKLIVKVKVQGEPSSDTPSPTSSAGVQPTNQPSGTPAGTGTPAPTGTAPAGKDPSPSPGTDNTPGPDQTPTPGPDNTPGPDQTSIPGPDNTSGPEGIEASHTVPDAGAEDTLTVGNIAVTLGMSKSEVKVAAGADPIREEFSPLGFDVYIYNPSGDYTNYLMLQFDQERLVGMTTLSPYFTYEGLLTSGTDTKDTLTGKGFSSIRSSYDYEQGYLYTGNNEYVLAFIDHQGSKKLYAVEIFAKQTSKNPSGDTKLDNLFKAENCSYNGTINNYMAQQLFDWACAFRATKGLSLFKAEAGKNGAQKHSDDMAANDFMGTDSSNGTNYQDRFDQEYGYWMGCAECYAGRSPDAFAFVTWIIDDTSDTKPYTNLTKTTDKYGDVIGAYYLNTGFSNNPSSKNQTFAVLDLYFY